MLKFCNTFFIGICILIFSNPLLASCPLSQEPKKIADILEEFFVEQAAHTPSHVISITLPEHFKPTKPEWGTASFRVGGAVSAPELGPDYRSKLEELGLVLRYRQDPTAYGGIRYTAMGTAAAVERARQYVKKLNAQQKATNGDSIFISSVEKYQPAPHEKWTYAAIMNFINAWTAAQDAFLPSRKAEGVMVIKDQLDTTTTKAALEKIEEPYGQLIVLVKLKDLTNPVKLKLQGKFSHLSQALKLLAARESITELSAEKITSGGLVLFFHPGAGNVETVSSIYLSTPSIRLTGEQTYADLLSQKPFIEVVQ